MKTLKSLERLLSHMFDYDSAEAIKAERLEEGHDRKVRNRIRFPYPDSLCIHCSHSWIYRTKRMNDPVIICQCNDKRVPLDIAECSKYQEIGKLDISTLAKMATMIESKDKDQAGFKVPRIGDHK